MCIYYNSNYSSRIRNYLAQQQDISKYRNFRIIMMIKSSKYTAIYLDIKVAMIVGPVSHVKAVKCEQKALHENRIMLALLLFLAE